MEIEREKNLIESLHVDKDETVDLGELFHAIDDDLEEE
jgi:hypothetical protein